MTAVDEVPYLRWFVARGGGDGGGLVPTSTGVDMGGDVLRIQSATDSAEVPRRALADVVLRAGVEVRHGLIGAADLGLMAAVAGRAYEGSGLAQALNKFAGKSVFVYDGTSLWQGPAEVGTASLARALSRTARPEPAPKPAPPPAPTAPAAPAAVPAADPLREVMAERTAAGHVAKAAELAADAEARLDRQFAQRVARRGAK